jgi:hypothetical protein
LIHDELYYAKVVSSVDGVSRENKGLEREEKTEEEGKFLKGLIFEADFHVFKHKIVVLHLVTSRR